jgi:SNF2 family DNA or RNA helicase
MKVVRPRLIVVSFDPHRATGHRLKSANNKTSKMFEHLRTPRRIILSGTPIQNDLSEFHAMVSCIAPYHGFPR